MVLNFYNFLVIFLYCKNKKIKKLNACPHKNAKWIPMKRPREDEYKNVKYNGMMSSR